MHLKYYYQFLYTVSALQFLLIINACKNKNDIVKTPKNESETKNILSTILNSKDDYTDLECTCISESTYLSPQMFRYGRFSDFLKNNLSINDTVHLNNQLKIHKEFKVSQELMPNWNILTEEKFRLYELSSYGNSLWDSLLMDCPKGFYIFSKPIFNEQYNRAIVSFGIICGRLCGGGVTRIYKLENNLWVVEKEISSWVS